MTRLILPGFYPDPSICRVGEDFYLTTSSFEYAPAVPLFTSRDLVTWRQIGNVLDRGTQFIGRPGPQGASTGIYAPTIRFHDGTYWMITTDRGRMRRGHLIVHAQDPAGPWSEPVFTTGITGIDPDLVWDEGGRSWVAWADPITQGIALVEVDLASGQLLGEPLALWQGTGLSHPEGPHLYRRGHWWYLVIAEGGTHTGHAVSVARSRALTGPYEAQPGGPLLTHRSTADPVQATGHADLVELADGSWAMVHLGIRQRGDAPGWHVNGRETFLTGVEWVDDWPVIDSRFDSPDEASPADAFVDDFTRSARDPRWISPGAHPDDFSAQTPDGLRLAPGRDADGSEAVHLIAVRSADTSWQASAQIVEGDAALVVRIDDLHWAALERVGDEIRARVRIGPLDQILATRADAPVAASLTIRVENGPRLIGVRSGPDTIRLGFTADGEFTELASFDGRYLSTEVAGGYTGRTIGLEALGAAALVRSFRYEPRIDPVAEDPYAALADAFGSDS